MEYTEEIKNTLIKINHFIQVNKNINYKIRLLEREVPNLQELVKKISIADVVEQSEQFYCDGQENNKDRCETQCLGCAGMQGIYGQ